MSPAPVGPPGDPYLNNVVADRYRILRKLGEGGMGVVYLAEHVIIEKRVALKILSEDLARKPDLVQRFMQEAKAASRIGHENIVDITDFGETHTGAAFFAMEFLDGQDLAHAIRDVGAMGFERARAVVLQICRALGAAHAKGIIHRDMKPENVFLVEREGRPDFVKILDFGIAKISAMDSEGGARLTRTGMIFGTPEYMSPEQARGDRPDHRVDIYAVGCILYEMLTGDVPFHAETFMGVLTKHMFEPPPPPSQIAPPGTISADVEAVVLRALAKDRDQRFQTMKEMALALAACGGHDATEGWGNEPSHVMSREELAGPRDALRSLRRSEAAMPVGGPSQVLSVAGSTESAGLEIVPDSPRGSGSGKLFAGLFAGLAIAGGIAALVMIKRPNPSTSPPPTVVQSPRVQPLEPAKTAPTPPVAARRYTVTVTSKPDGAAIFRGDTRLGLTPATLELQGDEKIELALQLKAHKEQTVEVWPGGPREVSVNLQRARVNGAPRGPGRELPRLAPSDPGPSTVKPAARPQPGGKLRDLKDPFSSY